MIRRAALALVAILTVAACSASDLSVEQASPAVDTTASPTTTTEFTIPEISAPPISEYEDLIPDVVPIDPRRRSRLRPADGVWFRLNNRQTGPVDEVALTVDGRLVVIEETNVYAGPADTWQRQLTPTGTRRTVELVESYGLIQFDGTCCLQGSAGLASTLIDPDYEPDHAGPREPWSPDTLTVYVQPPDIDAAGPIGQPIPWPLPGRILDRAAGVRDLPYTDEAPFLCLSGPDAATLWGVLGNGLNTAWLPADDGTGPFLLRVDVQWPGYRLYGDPCG